MKKSEILKYAATATAFIVLAGCSGGSSSSSTPAVTPTPVPTPTPVTPTPAPTLTPEAEPAYYNNGMPADMKTDSRGLPLLHSLPSAKGQIYLDFDGDFDLGKFHPGVDFDGDPDTYNSKEQEFIYNWWISTAAHFSMFDIDVTTEIDITRPNSWNAIFPGGKVGVAYGGYGVNSADIAQMTAGHGPYSSVVGHEGGHTFGLPHVVGLDDKGEVNSGYYGSPYPLRGWHLGAGDRIVNKWSNKFRSGHRDSYFGGVEHIASRIVAYDDTSTGYRPDLYHEDLNSATQIKRLEHVGFMASGVISTMNDVDSFYFDWEGGFASISSHAFELSPVNIELSLLDSNHQTIALNHNGINHQWISGELAAGRYYVKLQSAKRYSDLGEYRLRINYLPGDWRTANIGAKRSVHSTFYNTNTQQWTLKATGGDIWGSSDNFIFVYQKLQGEGSIVAKLDKNSDAHSWAKFGVMIRGDLSQGGQHFSHVLTGSHGANAFYRSTLNDSTAHVSAGNDTARWLKVERLESTDAEGNKTGLFNLFKASISIDGNNWELVTEQELNFPDEVYIGLAQATQNSTSMLTGVFSSVTVTGSAARSQNENLSAPSNLTAASIDHQVVSLQWGSNESAAEYIIERSEDGLSYIELAKSTVTDYLDNTVEAARPYSYRVSALNTQGQSFISSPLNVMVRSEGPQDLRVISYSANSLILDWGEPLGQRGYQVERSTDGSTFTVVATNHSGYDANVAKNSHAETQKYVDKNLESGTQYYYRITTLDAQGLAGSSLANGYTFLGTPKPVLSVVDKDNKSVTFGWETISGAENIEIERKEKDAETWTALTILDGSIKSFTDTTLGDAEQYVYRIKATSASNQGSWKEFTVLMINQRIGDRYMNHSGDAQFKLVAGDWGSMIGEPDATVQWSDSSDITYIFKGKYYWRYNNTSGEVVSEARLIKGSWKGPLGNDPYWYDGIDAAVRWDSSKVYFFKGDRYIRMFTSNESSSDGLTKIADGWKMTGDYADFATGIDAAMNSGDGKLFFFKGDKYVRHNMASDTPELGPLPMIGSEVNWGAWDRPIGAAFKSSQATFLFENH